jgi:hypothetical protein
MLVAAGHEVTGTTRSPDGDAGITVSGVRDAMVYAVEPGR